MAALHVVILAAGRGSRLGSLGERTPKWLLEVGERPIADCQLEGLDMASQAVASVRVVTGHAREAIDGYLCGRDVRVVHNADYARLNNWYSVLLALRSIDTGGPVVLINGDLFARAEWFAGFLVDAARADADGLIAVDRERPLTDESMKVAADDRSNLSSIGKAGLDEPVGEYVGMLMAGGPVLAGFRGALEDFERHPQSADAWYERAVALAADAGCVWSLWPTPDGHWIEIDDDADHRAATAMAAR